MKRDVAKVAWEEAFPPTDIHLKIDANQDKHISSAIHELLHVVLCGMVVGYLDSELEEVCIRALEKHIYDYVVESPRRESNWNRLIEQKLAERKEKCLSEQTVQTADSSKNPTDTTNTIVQIAKAPKMKPLQQLRLTI